MYDDKKWSIILISPFRSFLLANDDTKNNINLQKRLNKFLNDDDSQSE